MTTGPKTELSGAPLEPSTREHGVWGTKSEAVGGFGESYEAQVARGSEPNLSDDLEEAPEDAPLGREVRKTLARAHIDAADLRVAVRGNHVTLLGSVRESLEKAQIEARARAIPGVAEVTNRLSVLSEGDPSR
jgi:osmotically-inducible protein OsmY